MGFGLDPQMPRVTVVRKDEASIKRRKKKTSSPFDIPSFTPPSFNSPFDTTPKKKGRTKKK